MIPEYLSRFCIEILDFFKPTKKKLLLGCGVLLFLGIVALTIGYESEALGSLLLPEYHEYVKVVFHPVLYLVSHLLNGVLKLSIGGTPLSFRVEDGLHGVYALAGRVHTNDPTKTVMVNWLANISLVSYLLSCNICYLGGKIDGRAQ